MAPNKPGSPFKNESDPLLNEEDTIPPMGLNDVEFQDAAQNLVNQIIGFYKSLDDKGDRLSYPNLKPGFMKELVPKEAPEKRIAWQDVFEDIKKVIFDTSRLVNSARNFSFHPLGVSYPSILGEMLCSALSGNGMTWDTSPGCTELESITMDWLAKALDLPQVFLNNQESSGGGIIQGWGSESNLVALIAARAKITRRELARDPNQTIHEITGRMVAYASKASHKSVEKAGLIALVNMRLLDFDENGSLRGPVLQNAIEEDRRNGKIPAYVCATLGTTTFCSFDTLDEIGPICQNEGAWLHVDAAHVGGALICPEYRYIAKGIEYASSFMFNPHKLLMVTMQCSAFWVKDSSDLTKGLTVDASYLQYENRDKTIQYQDWQIPLSRQLRSIKLWFVMRMIGLEGLRYHIRQRFAQAKHFQKLILADNCFEVIIPAAFGVVGFRAIIPNMELENVNHVNKQIYQKLKEDRKFAFMLASIQGKAFLRVCVSSNFTTTHILTECWSHVKKIAEDILKNLSPTE